MNTRVAMLLVGGAVACGNNAGCEGGHREQPQVSVPQPQAAPDPDAQLSAAETPSPAAARGDVNAAGRGYPVKWSSASALALNAASEAQARYLLEEPDLFGELEGDGTKVRPTNCAQWAELHAKKYVPASGLEETPDSGAKLRCSTLKLIETAKPAERSYVRDLSWDRNMLSILPVSIATAVHEDDESAIAAASAAGKSIKQFDPKAQIKPSTDKETLEIIEGDKQTMIVLYPMAWGDFNGDGTDDMAMTVVNGATHGTLAYSRLLTVTRKSRSETLQVIGAR